MRRLLRKLLLGREGLSASRKLPKFSAEQPKMDDLIQAGSDMFYAQLGVQHKKEEIAEIRGRIWIAPGLLLLAALAIGAFEIRLSVLAYLCILGWACFAAAIVWIVADDDDESFQDLYRRANCNLVFVEAAREALEARDINPESPPQKYIPAEKIYKHW